ncbi:MAG: outer membrane beta-barrel protein [Cruoricaptor ignavus]|nr:outer membrane beta-barrel protein [Cruoricaptor ignavus]
MKKTLSIVLIVVFGGFYSAQKEDSIKQKNTTKTQSIEGVIITSARSPKVVKKDGKYEISVTGKDFQDTPSVWEGMKQIPMLNISEGEAIKVQGRTAILEVNGVQMQMSGGELEDYLQSLDPKSIRKITIDTTPDSSYGSEVNAIVNITLSQREGSFQVGANTTNGIRTRYYNNSGINYGISGSNFRLYTSYNFGYVPTENESFIQQKIENNPLLLVNYRDRNISRSHRFFVNGKVDLGEKSILDFSGIYSESNGDKAGISENESFSRTTNFDNKGRTFQFSEVLKHHFNDENTLKIGSYQIFNKNNSNNIGAINNVQSDHQYIATNIPIFIAFSDYSNKNKLGKTNAGIRFHSINVENDNQSYIGSNLFSSPFQYHEKVLASYINHSFSFSKNRSLRLGLRSETTMIDYSFKGNNLEYARKKDYTNLLYDVSYNWASGSWEHNISFRKQIIRPNYGSLNPFRTIGDDITYTSGDSEIAPAKIYGLNYQTIKNKWIFYAMAGYFQDFISSFFDLENGRINSTYKNFENVYFGNFSAEYNTSFFSGRLISKASGLVQFIKLDDKEYNAMLSKTIPTFVFTTNHILKLGKNYKLNLNYKFVPTYIDGLIKHRTTQKLDLTLSKKINSNFNLMIFANDIFRTSRSRNETTVPNYLYGNDYYGDVRSFGFTLKWNFTGKAYRQSTMENTTDSTLDRLK